MQVVVNQKVIDAHARYARIGTWLGLAALTAGFAVSFFPDYIWLAWGAMIVGLSGFNYGRFNSVRWVQRPRDDELVALNLKGLDHRHRLLNYMPETGNAGHVLLSPHGLYTINVRRDDGKMTNTGSKWKSALSVGKMMRALFEGGFGNPTQDALRDAAVLRRFLVRQLGEEETANLPIQPLLLFVHPRADLTVVSPTVPVLRPRELKDYMRRAQRQTRLSVDQLTRVNEAFGIE